MNKSSGVPSATCYICYLLHSNLSFNFNLALVSKIIPLSREQLGTGAYIPLPSFASSLYFSLLLSPSQPPVQVPATAKPFEHQHEGTSKKCLASARRITTRYRMERPEAIRNVVTSDAMDIEGLEGTQKSPCQKNHAALDFAPVAHTGLGQCSPWIYRATTSAVLVHYLPVV